MTLAADLEERKELAMQASRAASAFGGWQNDSGPSEDLLIDYAANLQRQGEKCR